MAIARARARAVCLSSSCSFCSAATRFGDGGDEHRQQQPRSTSSPRLLRPK